MTAPRISIGQWAALVSIVESGSYAKAGASLNKSQSTLAYAVQQIESLLKLRVFEIRGRKAVLTPAGEVLYRRGKTLVEDAARLELAAGELAKGREPEIRLAVETVFPTWLLLDCFSAFGREYADTRLELYETVLGGNEELLVSHKVDLAIAPRVPEGFAGDPLTSVRFVCVAAPSHPLHRLAREVAPEELRAYRYVVIRDTGVQRTPSGSWLTVSHKATSIRAAVMGLGYAWHPEDSVRQELDDGTLKIVPLSAGGERVASLYLVYADRETAGPGTRRLAEIIREKVGAACRAVNHTRPQPPHEKEGADHSAPSSPPFSRPSP
jgi:DNA-binding transcriptional LysR family regulator